MKIDSETLAKVQELPAAEQEEILKLLEEIDEAEKKEAAQEGFIPFAKYMWPAFIEGRHHKIMAEAFEKIARGELKRLIVNMPPRHTKSEFVSC